MTVIGARPQFIKAAPVSRAMSQSRYTELLVHTGQHYDYLMSQAFFEDLELPEPDINLGIGSASHGRQTGQMLMDLEEVMQAHQPDWVLVYGDTNSTLAGALAACKLRIPLAHVESGLRSFNREMPEEYNRVLADHSSDLLFCPTQTAVDNLESENITRGVHLVGDPMFDAVLQFREVAEHRSTVLRDLGVVPKRYLLTTLHRPYNSDVPENLRSILKAFGKIGEPIVFPVHPRTREQISLLGSDFVSKVAPNVIMVEPMRYLDMLVLEDNSRLIMTDSGGVQREAYFFGVPCLTLRPETEWTETVEAGWNLVVGADSDAIYRGARRHDWPNSRPPAIFGTGRSAFEIVDLLD